MTKINLTKSLFIGVGGFGKSTLRSIRRKFLENYGPKGLEIPAVRYLFLDTAPVKQEQYKSPDALDNECLPRPDRQEFVDLSVPAERMRAIQDVELRDVQPHARAALEGVLTPRLRQVSDKVLIDGAAGMRAFGIISFVQKVVAGGELQHGLESVLRPISELRPGHESWDPFREEFTLANDGQRLRIVLMASIAGGTGSGTILDLAYFLRALIRIHNITPEPKLELHLFLPELIEGESFFASPRVVTFSDLNFSKLVRSGAAAALAELEAYCSGAFEADKGAGFRFDRGFKVSRSAYEPFWRLHPDEEQNRQLVEQLHKRAPADEIYLIGRHAKDRKASLTGPQDGIEMAADLQFSRMTIPELDDNLRGDVTNVAQEMPGPVETGQGPSRRFYMRNYVAYGLAKVSVQAPLVRRWAATVQASQLLDRLLVENRAGVSASPEAVSRLAHQLGWSGAQIFKALAAKTLPEVSAQFTAGNLTSIDRLETLAAQGETSPFFGIVPRPAAPEAGRALPAPLQETLESVLQREGSATVQSIVAELKSLVDRDARPIRDLLQRQPNTISKPEAYESGHPVLEWLASVAPQFDWLGEQNLPRTPALFHATLNAARTAAEHLGELNSRDLPPGWGERVRDKLIDRFVSRFLSGQAIAGLHGSGKERGSLNEIAAGNPARLASLAARLRAGLARTVHALAEATAAELEAWSAALDGARREASGNLLNHLKEIRDGLTNEEKALRSGADRTEARSERVVRADQWFMKPENLVPWNDDDFERASQHLAAAFLEKDGEPRGPYRLSMAANDRLWPSARSLAQVRERLVNRLAQDADLIRFHPAKEPTLLNYYQHDSMNFRRQLADHIDKVVAASEPYLDFDQIAIGANNQRPGAVHYVLVPKELGQVAMEEKGSAYRITVRDELEDIVAVTVQPGISLPFVKYLQDLNNEYRKIEAVIGRPDFAWTRSRRSDGSLPSELIIPEATDMKRLPEIILGLLVGNIRYRADKRQFLAETAAVGTSSYFQETVVGESVADVIKYFQEGYKTFKRVDPLPHLNELNARALSSRRTVAKLIHLTTFLDQQIFVPTEDGQGRNLGREDHRYILDVIDQRIKNAMHHNLGIVEGGKEKDRFDNETGSIGDWLHAYCDLIPIHKPSVPPGADVFESAGSWDFIPVLAPGWDPAAAVRVSRWYNRMRRAVEAPNTPEPQEHRQHHVWALTSRQATQQIRLEELPKADTNGSGGQWPPHPSPELLQLMWD